MKPTTRKRPRTTEPADDIDEPAITIDPGATALEDAFDAFDEPGQEIRQDLFDRDPIKEKALEDRQIDRRIVTVKLWKFLEGDTEKTAIPGHHAIEHMSLEKIRQTWGDGLYQLRGFNRDTRPVAYGRHNLKPIPMPRQVPQVNNPAPAAQGAPPATTEQPFEKRLMEMFMTAMVNKMINGDAPGAVSNPSGDPMRDAMAQIVKTIALQQQLASTHTQTQLSLLERQNAPAAQQQDRLYSLVEKLLVSGGKPAGGGTLAEQMPLLQLGLSLGRQMAGGHAAIVPNPTEEQPAPWLQVVPEIADTVGVPLIVTMAQAFLPPDKAKAVLEAIEYHSKARTAEAEAAVKTSGETVEIDP